MFRLTLEMLRTLGACRPQREMFETTFPDGATIEDLPHAMAEGFDLNWLVVEALPEAVSATILDQLAEVRGTLYQQRLPWDMARQELGSLMTQRLTQEWGMVSTECEQRIAEALAARQATVDEAYRLHMQDRVLAPYVEARAAADKQYQQAVEAAYQTREASYRHYAILQNAAQEAMYAMIHTHVAPFEQQANAACLALYQQAFAHLEDSILARLA